MHACSLADITIYPYHTGGAWVINATSAQYHYEQLGVRFQSQYTGAYKPSQYYPEYTNVWIASTYGYSTDVNTWADIIAGSAYDKTKEQFYARSSDAVVQSGLCGIGYLRLHTHYPVFANEQPWLECLEDVYLKSGIFPMVGASSWQMALAERTYGQNGSYSFDSLLYYPSDNLLTFKLVQDGDAPPDNICGIIVADPTARMPDAIMTDSKKLSTFFLFKYEADKIYTIDLSQAPSNPYVKRTEGWLTSASYQTNKFTFTVSASSGTTSTTKVYCGDEGEPVEVYVTNGTLMWSYNASTKILTLNVTHLSPARIVVYWRFPGDIDGDGDVDSSDFYVFAGNYGKIVCALANRT